MVGPLSVHIYLPGLGAIQHGFQVSVATAQLTLSIALFTMAGATLAYGGLSDRHGRRPMLLVGLGLFTAGAAICALAPDIATLLVGRFVQAAGAACGLVLARAMARDVYGVDRLVRVIAYLTIGYVIGPMVAPAVGGALIAGFGWRAIFAFGVAAGVAIVVLAAVVLDETHRERGGPARITLLAGYWRLLRDPRFTGYVMNSGFASGAFFAYISAASFLMTETMARPASEYGLYFLVLPLGYVAGNMVAARLGGRIAVETMMVAGSVVSTAGIAALGIVLSLAEMTPLTLFLPGAFMIFGQGLSMPNAQSGAIAADRDLAGTASGIVMFVQLFLGALLSQLTGLAADGTQYPMLAIAGGSTLASLAAAAVPALLKPRAATD